MLAMPQVQSTLLLPVFLSAARRGCVGVLEVVQVRAFKVESPAESLGFLLCWGGRGCVGVLEVVQVRALR